MKRVETSKRIADGRRPGTGFRETVSAERKRYILTFYEAGLPLKVIAKKFGVSESYPSQLASRMPGGVKIKREIIGDVQIANLTQAMEEVVLSPEPPAFPKPAAPPAARAGELVGADLVKPKGGRPRLVERPKPAPVAHPIASADEIRRLAKRGVGRTGIAAMLRCSYREIDAALSRP